ncbi:MAG TPA: HD domain-containing phosphohydrolase [Verrucomicrobiota bacterium]|nr:HD domain-containing phosphohydrolase [Verrucomicrobiota bacterium]
MAVKAKQQDIRALLVEENEIIIDSLTEIMKSQGFNVITHKDPAQAINLMKGGSLSVVIVDDKCGGKEGLEILEVAKKEIPAATRLLLTSRVNDDLVQAAVKDRLIYRYITKPWLTEDLVLTLKTAADTFRLAEKNASLLLEKNDLERTVRDLEKVAAAGGGQGSAVPAAVQAAQTEVVAEDGDAGTVMQTMIEMLYVFHPNLKSNAIRTMALVKTVAETLKMEKLAADSLYQAAALHDIAIPGVDRPIIRRWLRDPEKCNRDEMKIIEQHPLHAVEMLKPFPMFKEAELIIRAHHEDWNGKGYPNRLKGETIPWEARLLRVALDFCSKHADPIQAMLDIEELIGDLYDPDAVRAIAKAVPLTEMPTGEREILLIELKEGMTIGRDISNTNGFLLFPKGKTLTQAMCDKLFSIDRISPLDPYVLVYC